MWWLQVVGLVAFAVVLVSGFVAWRKTGAPGTSRAYVLGLFAVGLALLAVGVWATVATA